MDEVRWYENNSLESIKNTIKENIGIAGRSFVTIGYYLKNVRDRELFLEDGYQNIWEFAQSEFAISKSSASRFMAINDRFSKDGNSPILLEQYKDFSSSKLSEMLTLSDEQLEQVTITTTRAEIREMKQPVKEEVVAHAQQEPVPKLCKWDGKSNCVAVCDIGTECCAECQEHGHCNAECGWQDERIPKSSGQCIHRPEFPCTLPEASKLAIGNGEDCNAKCCWGCPKHGDCGYECNSSAHRSETVNDESEIVDNVVKSVIKTTESVFEEPENAIEEKSCSNCTYNDMDPDKYRAEHPDEKEFPCNSCDDKLNHWVPNLPSEECIKCSLRRNTEAGILECHPEKGEHKCWTADEPYSAETVEADIIQAVPESPIPFYSAEHHLREAIKQEEKQIATMRDYWKDNQPDTLLKHETILIALKCYLTDMEYPDPEPKIIHKYQVDPYEEKDIFEMVLHEINTAWDFFDKKDYSSADFYLFNARKELWENEKYEFERHEPFRPKFQEGKVKQPELPILKNNDQRKEFIEAYETWPIWIDIKETGERYYRYNLTDKVAIVVKVNLRHVWKQYKETHEIYYGAEQYYLLGVKTEWHANGMVITEDDTRTFYECQSNKTALVEYLKYLQKKGAVKDE